MPATAELLPISSPSDAAQDADDDVGEAADTPASVQPVNPPQTTPANKASRGEADEDRWSGTMAQDWDGNTPQPAPHSKDTARPKLTLEEAIRRVPPDALQYLRNHLRSDVTHLKAYDPSLKVK